MNKSVKYLWMGLVSCCLRANVNLVTTVEDIDYRGVYEKAGSISFVVDGNDFFPVTAELPYYIRVRLDKGARLAETLVAPTVVDHEPILLGAFVTGADETINIDPDDIAIVRWKAQEVDIWLRVTSSSNTWINVGGNPTFPSINRLVTFRIGLTSEESFGELNPLFLQGKANLPSNANGNGDPVSTAIFVDASQSILTLYPHPGSDLQFDTIAFDFQTQGVETAETYSMITLGSDTTANFSGDSAIAIAHALNRSVPTLGSLGTLTLCILMAIAWFRYRPSPGRDLVG